MKSAAITEFVELVRRDAAVQERVAVAAKQKEPLHAIVKVASGAGFEITTVELQAALEGELSPQELAAVSGGLSSPLEWFAEQYSSIRLRKD